jgi:hypothetical protein
MLWWHFLLLSTVLVILAAEKNHIYSKHRLAFIYSQSEKQGMHLPGRTCRISLTLP